MIAPEMRRAIEGPAPKEFAKVRAGYAPVIIGLAEPLFAWKVHSSA